MKNIAYQELIEQHGAIGFEKQYSFFEIIGESNWSIDLDVGFLSFSNSEMFKVQVLGSYSKQSETWLWAWANEESKITPDLLLAANALQEYGLGHELKLLTTARFDCLPSDLQTIGMIASSIQKASAYYCASHSEGILLLLITSDKVDNLPYDEQTRITTTLSNLISAYEIDHKKTFSNYVVAKGYTLSNREQNTIARKGDKIIEATFDDMNRITNISQEIK